MRTKRAFVTIAATMGTLVAACGTVDVGPPLTDVNACRPDPQFFADQIWPNVLDKDYGGKRCSDAGCHDASVGRELRLARPTSAFALPMPPDWAALYQSVTKQVLCTNVSSSALLTRPDGRQPHGGEKLFEPNGPEEMLVKMWLEVQ